MTRYIVRRLLSLPLLLLGIVSLAFLISHATQGDPLAAIVSERQMDNEEVVAAAKAQRPASAKMRRMVVYFSWCSLRLQPICRPPR